jgi:hypothetical protein
VKLADAFAFKRLRTSQDANAGGGLASNLTHHDPSALHRHYFDRGTAFYESAFGDHVHALAVDAGGARGPQLGKGHPRAIQEFRFGHA